MQTNIHDAIVLILQNMNQCNYLFLDIDECKINSGGCEYECKNNIGTFECLCPVGRVLNRLVLLFEIELNPHDKASCFDLSSDVPSIILAPDFPGELVFQILTKVH